MVAGQATGGGGFWLKGGWERFSSWAVTDPEAPGAFNVFVVKLSAGSHNTAHGDRSLSVTQMSGKSTQE